VHSLADNNLLLAEQTASNFEILFLLWLAMVRFYSYPLFRILTPISYYAFWGGRLRNPLSEFWAQLDGTMLLGEYVRRREEEILQMLHEDFIFLYLHVLLVVVPLFLLFSKNGY